MNEKQHPSRSRSNEVSVGFILPENSSLENSLSSHLPKILLTRRKKNNIPPMMPLETNLLRPGHSRSNPHLSFIMRLSCRDLPFNNIFNFTRVHFSVLIAGETRRRNGGQNQDNRTENVAGNFSRHPTIILY